MKDDIRIIEEIFVREDQIIVLIMIGCSDKYVLENQDAYIDLLDGMIYHYLCNEENIYVMPCQYYTEIAGEAFKVPLGVVRFGLSEQGKESLLDKSYENEVIENIRTLVKEWLQLFNDNRNKEI